MRLAELRSEPGPAWGHHVSVQGGHSGGNNSDDIEEVGIPMKSIKVKTEITMITSDRLDYNDRLF